MIPKNLPSNLTWPLPNFELFEISFSVRNVLKFKSVLNVLIILFLKIFSFIWLCQLSPSLYVVVENMAVSALKTWNMNLTPRKLKLIGIHVSKLQSTFRAKTKKLNKERVKRKASVSVTFFTETNPFSSLTEM